MNKKLSIILTLLVSVPLIASAQTKNLAWLINTLTGYLNMILVLMMGVAVVLFVFYIIKYFIMPNDNRGEAGKYVMYSVIGFFVILSFWGIVNILQNTFGLKNENNRPASWASFSNLFPSGGSSGGGTIFDGGSSGGNTNYGGGSSGGNTNFGGGSSGGNTNDDECDLGEEGNGC